MGYDAFSDESQHKGGRFRSIGAVSLPSDVVVETSNLLGRLVGESDVKEFKWNMLKSAKGRFCAIKLVDFVFDTLLPAGGRIDVLVWDTQDVRHAVQGRDDRKNFERMYFHLHSALMGRRELGAEWHLRPDERLDIDWDTISQCLGAKGRWRRDLDHPLLQESFSEAFFQIRSLTQVDSKVTPLCQMADLFAGMAPYSRASCEKLKWMLQESDGQTSLFAETTFEASRKDVERFQVIQHLYTRARRSRLGISFRSQGYLATRDPRNPINFWHYVPQHAEDRAPVRNG